MKKIFKKLLTLTIIIGIISTGILLIKKSDKYVEEIFNDINDCGYC